MTSLLFRLVLIDLALVSVSCTLNTTAESILFSCFFPFYLTVFIWVFIQSSQITLWFKQSSYAYQHSLHRGKKIDNIENADVVTKIYWGGVTQVSSNARYFDLTCSPILAASHFNTARIENGDAPFFSKFASELCAGTRTCVGKTPLCSEMYFQTPVLELWGKKRGGIEM